MYVVYKEMQTVFLISVMLLMHWPDRSDAAIASWHCSTAQYSPSRKIKAFFVTAEKLKYNVEI